MRLFINSGVCKRKWNGNVSIRRKDGILTLRIPNYNPKTSKHEYVEFILPTKCTKKMLKNDVIILNLSLEKISENKYIFTETYYNDYSRIYALVRNADIVSDDIYIKSEEKSKVKVIRRMRFVDDECDYGEFLSNVYFLEIKLNPNEKFALYPTYQNNSGKLNKIITVYRPKILFDAPWFIEEKKIEPISIGNDKRFISLSELI